MSSSAVRRRLHARQGCSFKFFHQMALLQFLSLKKKTAVTESQGDRTQRTFRAPQVCQVWMKTTLLNLAFRLTSGYLHWGCCWNLNYCAFLLNNNTFKVKHKLRSLQCLSLTLTMLKINRNVSPMLQQNFIALTRSIIIIIVNTVN